MIRKLSACCLILVLQALCGTAHAVTFNIFTDPHPTMGPGTVGFAYAGNKFVGSVLQNGSGSLYSTDLVGGNVQPFAPGVSLTSSSGEHFVAASFGLGGFPTSDVYAADGSNIVHVTNNGAASNSFVTGLGGEVRGITFDLVGTFGNNMLVTTSAGNVYQVNNAGTPTLLANVGEDVEGLDVAPLGNGFSVFDGQLIVASEGSGSIRAISPGGVVTPLSNGSLGGPILINSAEELTFVPLNLGVSGNPLEGLYGRELHAQCTEGRRQRVHGHGGGHYRDQRNRGPGSAYPLGWRAVRRDANRLVSESARGRDFRHAQDDFVGHTGALVAGAGGTGLFGSCGPAMAAAVTAKRRQGGPGAGRSNALKFVARKLNGQTPT